MRKAKPLDGINVIDVLLGKMKERPKPIPFQHKGGAALISNSWKLIREGRNKGGATHLFELTQDMGESQSLQQKEAKRFQAMQSDMAAWEQRVQQESGKGGRSKR